jgi:hypothetical protein
LRARSLYAAEHPIRDILVGGIAPLQSAMGRLTPRLGDRFVNATMFTGQQSNRRPGPTDNQVLDHASGELEQRGFYPDVTVFERSLYTETAMRSALKRLLATGMLLGVGATMLVRSRLNNSKLFRS